MRSRVMTMVPLAMVSAAAAAMYVFARRSTPATAAERRPAPPFLEQRLSRP